ncbi:IclR family transcriptional regulator [Verticiella sediminum]|uniref:IclR family transcriptional regulator n=1 Tax=Verticiella sediminum TaxID=1247510 RepID=A0A556ATP6_9BURK|nr:IclR family transcriptional regulator [Verticiella sediminum]TSH96313.1 IclR family transcriptional regulator [Verticiella sediminum]
MEPDTVAHPARQDAVQSVKRALDILRMLSFTTASSGMRFSDLQAQSGLSKGTLHRLLKTLMADGFVEQAAGSRAYFLGLEFLSMGERASNRLDIQAVTRPSLERLAQATGDTVMLTIRSGLDAVCIDREEGPFPVKVLTQNVGTRRPLGVGSGSLALLAAFADEEVENVLRRNRDRLQAYPRLDTDKLRALVQDTRTRGYALNTGHLLKGMYGVGVAIRLGKQPVAALSIAANHGRMGPERRQHIAAQLRQEVLRIEGEMGSRASVGA